MSYKFYEYAVELITLVFLHEPFETKEDEEAITKFIRIIPEELIPNILIMLASYVRNEFHSLESWQAHMAVVMNVFENSNWTNYE